MVIKCRLLPNPFIGVGALSQTHELLVQVLLSQQVWSFNQFQYPEEQRRTSLDLDVCSKPHCRLGSAPSLLF